jgi:hypothetical protein
MTEFDLIYVILRELSKLDGKPIWIGNITGGAYFHPPNSDAAKKAESAKAESAKTESAVFNEGRIKRALSKLFKLASEDLREAINADDDDTARELLMEEFPALRHVMRDDDIKRKKLFELAPRLPVEQRERARRIMRKYAPKSVRDIFSDETWPKVRDEFIEKKIAVPTRRKPRPQWSDPDMRPGTRLFRPIKRTLIRYYVGYKTKAEREAEKRNKKKK